MNMNPDLVFALQMAAVVAVVVALLTTVAAVALGAFDGDATGPGSGGAAGRDIESALGAAVLMSYEQAAAKYVKASPSPATEEDGEEARCCAICLCGYAKGDELVRALLP